MGMISPYITAINEGKVACKFIYETMDRKPTIDQDQPGAEEIDFSGDITFEKAVFYYPSRPGQRVLNEFSTQFLKGQTTAICGPSGAGKSSIVQLIMRYYDLSEGSLKLGSGSQNTSNTDIKKVNLRKFRQ